MKNHFFSHILATLVLVAVWGPAATAWADHHEDKNVEHAEHHHDEAKKGSDEECCGKCEGKKSECTEGKCKDAECEDQEACDNGSDGNDHGGDDRVANLITAAEHLERAGFADEAHEYFERAEEMSRHEDKADGPLEALERHVHELREVIEGLRREMNELREHVEQRGDEGKRDDRSTRGQRGRSSRR